MRANFSSRVSPLWISGVSSPRSISASLTSVASAEIVEGKVIVFSAKTASMADSCYVISECTADILGRIINGFTIYWVSSALHPLQK